MFTEHTDLTSQTAAEYPRVLFAGFIPVEADAIRQSLALERLTPVFVREHAELRKICKKEQFDFAVLDVGNIDVFAPQAIREFRACSGPSSDVAILAVDSITFEGLSDQLLRAGADLVIQKPSNPRNYLGGLSKAADLNRQFCKEQ